ncbi:MAG: glycosyl transferase [Actinomycetota bacterium]
MSLVSGLIALGTTVLLSPVVLWLLERLRLVDTPNYRSLHDKPTPRGGGLAVLGGAVVGLVLQPQRVGLTALLAGALAFGILGFADDVRGIPAIGKLLMQGLITAGLLPSLIGSVSGSAALRVAVACLVLLWIVSFVNAFNFMDGINGISATQALIAGGYWFFLGTVENVPELAVGGLVIAGAALGFAPFNFPRALMFLGDVGSYFIGAWMAILVVIGIRAGLVLEAVLAPVALYLADTFLAIVRRVRRGERWHEAHRDHVYQRLVALGWSHTRTTGFVGIVVLACSAIGAVTLVVQPQALRVLADAAIVSLLGAYLLSPALVKRRRFPSSPSISPMG